MGHQPRLVVDLLRVPLAWKIAGANALLTIALIAGFYLIPGAVPHPVTRSIVVVAAMLLAGAANVVLITLALDPIRRLERTAETVWSGATAVRVESSPFADRDLRRVAHTVDDLLERLASDRARLRQLTAQLVEARSSERSMIARELTESVAQSAAGLALECAALKSNGNAEKAERIERIILGARSLVEEIRRIARDLHPRHIDELGLDVALRSLAREAHAVNMRVLYSSDGIPATAETVPRLVAAALYEVAREGLKNARRHSGAAEVRLSLGIERHAATLRVSDNGSGFDPNAVPVSLCAGLSTMRERVELLGGRLEINSASGRGTSLVAIIPLASVPSEQSRSNREESFKW